MTQSYNIVVCDLQNRAHSYTGKFIFNKNGLSVHTGDGDFLAQHPLGQYQWFQVNQAVVCHSEEILNKVQYPFKVGDICQDQFRSDWIVVSTNTFDREFIARPVGSNTKYEFYLNGESIHHPKFHLTPQPKKAPKTLEVGKSYTDSSGVEWHITNTDPKHKLFHGRCQSLRGCVAEYQIFKENGEPYTPGKLVID